MGIKVGYKDGFIEFNQPDKSEDNWVVIKSESVAYDKKALILDKFRTDFPHLPISGVDDDVKFDNLTRLCGRTRELARWFAQANLLYSDLTQLPLYLKDHVEPGAYSKIKDKVLLLNKKAAANAEARRELALEYEKKVKRLDAEYKADVSKFIGSDKVLKIITLTAEAMPASLQLALDNYTPADKEVDIGESRKRYAREMLIQFKIKLLEIIEADPSIDIDELVSSMALK